ncbi:MAG: carbohydrate ABC transporter permease [Caldilinea sp.]|nr:carbohydrate ABC transporter permease [Caldilinea sp.]MDW8440065.1 carbohydrate ABC transporter permease [Caldilineaceae bacterium]
MTAKPVATTPKVDRLAWLRDGRTWLRTILIVFIVFIFVFPIYFWFLASFKPFGLIFTLPPVFFFEPTFTWYSVVLGGVPYNKVMLELTGALTSTGGGLYYSVPYIIDSIIIATISTLLVVLVGTPAAYALSRFPMRRRHDVAFWILSTRMMPVVVAAMPFFLMYRALGWIDTYHGVVLVHTVINLPLAILLLKSFFDEVPFDLDEAAMVDGATRWQAFYKVIIYYVLPGLAATAILSFIFSWNEFLLTLTLTRTSVRTMPVAASTFDTATGGTEWGFLAALGTSAMVSVFIFVLFVQRHLVRGLTMGAVKG